MRTRIVSIAALATLLTTPLAIVGAPLPGRAALRVVATVPDLADLARTLGGDHVDVMTLTRGPQDPHYVEPRPSFVRALHRADLLLVMGMDLEIGWLPPLLQSARNARIQPGASGYLDASAGIRPLEVPGRGADRSLGDLHPYGNPHYLTDPLNGIRVSEALRDRLGQLEPEHAAHFREHQRAFARRVLERLVGAGLVARHSPQALITMLEQGRFGASAERGEDGSELGGWLAALQGVSGTKAVEEHRFWAYFAHRFGLQLVGTLEPFAGVAPTTRHLAKVVALIESQQVPLILSSAYFDPRHARWVAERSGARIVPLAHQVGARPGVDDYLAVLDYNLAQLLEALGKR